MKTQIFYEQSETGWLLHVKRFFLAEKQDKQLRPLLIVPGYGMNSFIFSYHPHDVSLIEYLCEQGFEVWTADLSAQGESVNRSGGEEPGLKELACMDLPVIIDRVIKNNSGGHEKIDLVGCSLGGTLIYIYTALFGTEKVSSVVGLGSPLRWEKINPLVRVLFSSPGLAGSVKVKNMRTIAKYALPILAKVPKLLHIYIHPEIVDLSKPEILTQTVEDPNRVINRQIATWLKTKDLFIDGKNITELFGKITVPLFLILCKTDGVVPPETALSALNTNSKIKEYVVAGNDKVKMAHADMYISRYARQFVFEPLASWLLKINRS